MSARYEGWHFLAVDRRLSYGDGRPVRVGETLRVKGPPRVGVRGLHASRSAIEALWHAPGPIACRVVLGGEIAEEEEVAAATERTVLALADATTLLHKYALWCAEGVIHLTGDGEPVCRAALEVKRRWLRGEATDADLAAAADNARAAAADNARAAAAAAARAAAYAADAAAYAAAWAAAAAAARAAAYAADAADYAVRAAADAVNAVRAAAWAAQNAELERRLRELLSIDPITR